MNTITRSNARTFENYLHNEEFYLEKVDREDGVIFFTEESIDNGPSVRLVIAFDDDRPNQIQLRCFNVGVINNPLKKEMILELFNALNRDYVFTRFLIDSDNQMYAADTIEFIDDTFSAAHVQQHVFMLYSAVKNEYSKIMKIMWS